MASPTAGVDGCVESEELKGFVAALEARRVAARDAALAALGARREVRRGRFADAASEPVRLGEVFEVEGQRFAVVAEYTRESEPAVALALQGTQVRRLEERSRAHGVQVLACGVTPCGAGRGGAKRRPVHAVVVELGAEEVLGEVLVVAYDYWWAQVSQIERERCPEGAGSAGFSSRRRVAASG